MNDRALIRPFLAMAIFALAGCSTTDTRYASPTIEPTSRVASRYASIEVRDVTLPAYAASEEIFVEGADGAITALGPLWADDPARAVGLQLSRDLAAITGATVAPEPWPFRGSADATLDVRFEEMLATAQGTFRISGQFFVAPDLEGRNSAEMFSISVPLSGPSPQQIAEARNLAATRLAVQIASESLR